MLPQAGRPPLAFSIYERVFSCVLEGWMLRKTGETMWIFLGIGLS